ncbi:putative RNA-binding, CRM domain, CRM-domain containing factor CFM3, YhbY-like superfamily [Dioscorea sansibarensis]
MAFSGHLLLRRFSSSTKSLNPSTTSPWIHGWSSTHAYLRAFPKKPRDVLDYSNDDAFSSDDDEVGTSRSTGSTTMRLILDKLQSLGLIEVFNSVNGSHPLSPEKGSVEDIFHAEDGVLPNTRGGLSPDFSEEVRRFLPGMPGVRKEKKKREIELSEDQLRRLRAWGLRIKSKVKIKGGGVTREVFDAIHKRWRSEEVVRLKCEGSAALNMRIMHETLERRTGGMVIWRSGTSILLYRGVGCGFPHIVKEKIPNQSSHCSDFLKTANCMSRRDPPEDTKDCNVQDLAPDLQSPAEDKKDAGTVPENKSQIEMEKLLYNLGPRYTDWPGSDPLPVDADLLPGTVPGYKPPFRVLPYGVKSSLGPKEGTTLRRLARLLPPHFALGRHRQYQGLAAAMLLLWEKCPIVKIALKHGVQLKTSERMAEEIKKMTGGTLLSRNKDYLVFYRGKSFLSLEVAEMLLEWEGSAKALV